MSSLKINHGFANNLTISLMENGKLVVVNFTAIKIMKKNIKAAITCTISDLVSGETKNLLPDYLFNGFDLSKNKIGANLYLLPIVNRDYVTFIDNLGVGSKEENLAHLYDELAERINNAIKNESM